MKKIDINKSISLNHIPDSKFKTSTISLFIHTPLCRENAAKNALIPMVLRRGCEGLEDISEIELYLQSLYGAELVTHVFRRGEDQILGFEIQTIADKYVPDSAKILSLAMELLLKIVFKPHLEDGVFSASYVEGEKNNLCDMIDGMVNDKQSYALWRCYEEMCKGEPFGVHEYGNTEDVKKITASELYEHYKNLLSTSKIDIFVCGEADILSIAGQLKAIADTLGDSEAGYPATSVSVKKGDEVKKVIDEFEANQAKLTLGFRTNVEPFGDNYVALMVANSILGSGAHSKLFNNVREKLSLAYYAFSRLEREKGLMIMGMGIEEQNYQKALDESLLQLKALKDGDVSEYEFISSKAALKNAAISSKDSQVALISFYLTHKIWQDNMTIDTLCEKIDAVTLEDAVAAAQNIELDTIYFLKGRG